jgi:hypothetical protein
LVANVEKLRALLGFHNMDRLFGPGFNYSHLKYSIHGQYAAWKAHQRIHGDDDL